MSKTIIKVVRILVGIVLIALAVVLIYNKVEQNSINEQKRIESQMKATRMKK